MVATKKRKVTEKQLANLKGHEFKKGVSGNPKGRPKNRILSFLDETLSKKKLDGMREDLTPSEIDTIEKKALQLELDDLQLVVHAEHACSYLKSIALAILTDMKNGRTTTVDKLRDRQYGSTKQNLEVSGGIDFTKILMETGSLDDIDLEEEEEE